MEIKLAENEKVIRNYRITEEGKKVRNTIDVTVTNKRLMRTSAMDGAGTSSTDVYQVPVEIIQNIVCGTAFKRKVSWLILGIVLAFASLCLTIVGFARQTIALVVVALLVGGGISAVMIVLGLFKKNYAYMEVFCNRSESVFTFGKRLKSVVKIDFKRKKALEPGLLKMIDELPALIIDIKEIGDAACDKWARIQ